MLVRFLLLSGPRCGSNHLMDLLRSHPKILTYPELFVGKSEPIHWDTHPRPSFDPRKAIAMRDDDPIRFLDELIFAATPEVDAVGFKIFYDHAATDEWRCVWDYLKRMRLKVVHLRRADILRSLVSLRLAQHTGKWTSMDGSTDPVSISLNLEECIWYFKQMQRSWALPGELFDSGTVLEVGYEDLCARQRHEAERVQQFLGVPVRSLSAYLEKQNPLPTWCYVSNYEALRNQARGSAWEAYFPAPAPRQ